MKKRKRKKRKEKMETSKKILLFADGLLTVACIAGIIISFVCRDTSPFAYIVPAISSLAATSHGFYYWKAKNENIQKYGNNVKDDDLQMIDLNDSNIMG